MLFYWEEIFIKNLLIIGAGGHGQCCHEIAERMKNYDKISFLDDGPEYELSDLVIGKIKELENFKSEYDDVFVAIGNNKVRCTLYKKVRELGFHIPTLIDPTAFVSIYCFIGEGTVVFPNAVLETHCYVGKECIISSNVTIHHDARVESFSLIYSNTVVRPEARIGTMSRIGSQCLVPFGYYIEFHSDICEGTIIDSNQDSLLREGV